MRQITTKIFNIIKRMLLAACVLSVALVLCLRWVNPPTSAVMVEARVARLLSGSKKKPIRYRWIDYKSISPFLPIAVVAAEDQKFPSHWGFDTESIMRAIESHERGHRLRGASTITQQVAKNLFLWQGRSYIRKGIEAYLTVLLETFWSKKRILEVYLNIAQFGNGVYGVRAASTTLLGKSPSRLTRADAALLAAVLPNPIGFKVRRPSSYVKARRRWIERQTSHLGGTGYLKDL